MEETPAGCKRWMRLGRDTLATETRSGSSHRLAARLLAPTPQTRLPQLVVQGGVHNGGVDAPCLGIANDTQGTNGGPNSS